ncbi:MAG: secretin N-terminal domain-containing protein [Pyrinomonadaceae bacterium]
MIACLIFTPLTALAKKKGEKNYKNGQGYEKAQQWEKAAQEYALAVASDPSVIEYQLHYRRALFQASQTFMQRGRDLAEKSDYVGAYNAFRQAYGFDQVNELALSEMQRMLRLQKEKQGIVDGDDAKDQPEGNLPGAKISPTAYQTGATTGGASQQQQLPDQTPGSARTERQRIISIAPGQDLKSFIQTLAREIDLNVIFDTQSFSRARTTELSVSGVTTAQALDYLFLKERLFFQRIDRKTIIVADQSQRMQYQPLGIRTFYLKNADPDKVKTQLATFIPPQPGRPPASVISNVSTNSLTIRDTPENLKVIEKIIESIDKDRAEVVMDVRIYEVTRTDLLQFGNQVGTTIGASSGVSLLEGSRQVAQQVVGGLSSAAVPSALGAALLLPSSVLTAMQSKDRARLVFQTQLHAFDNEDSSADVGQKVPIQTATVPNYGFQQTNQTPGQGQGQSGVPNQGAFGSYGYPVVQYADVGLKLKFKPQVFPNRDVQVKMEIESTALTNAGDAGQNLTPSFSQRVIKGMARIPNNRTMMVANIAQDQEVRGQKGLPLIGLIPGLGRLFVSPTRNNVQSDIVLVVTPHVIRAPDITPNDQLIRPSGTMQSPTTETLANLLEQEAIEDRQLQLAAARRAGIKIAEAAKAELPPAQTQEDLPAYLPAPKILAGVPNPSAGSDVVAVNASGSAQRTAVSFIEAPAPVPAPQLALAQAETTPASIGPPHRRTPRRS